MRANCLPEFKSFLNRYPIQLSPAVSHDEPHRACAHKFSDEDLVQVTHALDGDWPLSSQSSIRGSFVTIRWSGLKLLASNPKAKPTTSRLKSQRRRLVPIHGEHEQSFSLHCLPTSFSDFHLPVGYPPHHPAATASNRSSVSGYLRTSRTKAAACGFGLARPCSHFSKVLSLIRSFRANTAREHPIRFRVSRINFESTSGSAGHFHLIAPQRQLPLAMLLHRVYAFH
jgi:hypothetical protein